jgi:hypothetical protein
MRKRRVVVLFITVITGVCLATAQNSKVGSGSSKPAPDPIKNVNKPLTPMSAMPAKRKAAMPVTAPKSGQNTTAELTHLEKQNAKAASPKSADKGTVKIAPLSSADTSAASGSKTNFKYQKPVGGVTASTPGANSRNSPAPRVPKH